MSKELLVQNLNAWFGKLPVTLPFHLASRDMVADRSTDDIAEFYRTHVMAREVSAEEEIAAGRLFRLTIPLERFG